MTSELHVTNQDIYRAKADKRKMLAKIPFEQKIEILLRMQHMNLEMKKAAGRARHAARPWDMSEDEYERYLNQ